MIEKSTVMFSMATERYMDILLKGYTVLADAVPSGGVVSLPAGSNVMSLLLFLGIKTEDVMLIFVNNAQVGMESVLHAGDNVVLFPLMGGG